MHTNEAYTVLQDALLPPIHTRCGVDIGSGIPMSLPFALHVGIFNL